MSSHASSGDIVGLVSVLCLSKVMVLAPMLVRLSRSLFANSAKTRTRTSPMNDSFPGEVGLPSHILQAHSDAVSRGQLTYEDPDSGLTVFTKLAHIRRGFCCGSGCRHCPYGHINVPQRKNRRPSALLKADAKNPLARPAEGAASSPSTSSAGHRASITTKTGDSGTSSLFDGTRVSKASTVFDLLGSVDELNAHLSVALAELQKAFPPTPQGKPTSQPAARTGSVDIEDTVRGSEVSWEDVMKSVGAALQRVQHVLMSLSSVVADPTGGEQKEALLERVGDETETIHSTLNALDSRLPTLHSFIIPGGGIVASQIHVARTVCRRAERGAVGAEAAPEIRKYLNRLSDLLFVCARCAAHAQGVGDVASLPAGALPPSSVV